MLGLQATALGVGEAFAGYLEGAEVLQGPSHARELLLQAQTEGALVRREGPVGPHDGQGSTQELLALLFGRCRPKGRDQSRGLAMLEVVFLGGTLDVLLRPRG